MSFAFWKSKTKIKGFNVTLLHRYDIAKSTVCSNKDKKEKLLKQQAYNKTKPKMHFQKWRSNFTEEYFEH